MIKAFAQPRKGGGGGNNTRTETPARGNIIQRAARALKTTVQNVVRRPRRG